MPERTITLTIPDAMYQRLQQRAAGCQRTIQDEILQAVAARAGELDSTLETDLSALSLLRDEELWQAACKRLPEEDSDRIETLQRKRGREGLSDEEERSLAGLLRFADRLMLVRAEAAALLKQRGHDVSVLLKAP